MGQFTPLGYSIVSKWKTPKKRDGPTIPKRLRYPRTVAPPSLQSTGYPRPLFQIWIEGRNQIIQ